MNTLDDLRRTLDAHAHAHDTRAGVDADALHERIRETRRRRAATRGGVVLAAVIAVASVAFLPRLATDDAAPASTEARTAFGHVAPATRTALGLTYAWESVAVDEEENSISMEPSTGDEPPLLSWATAAPDAEVTVTDGDGTLLWTSRTGGFADHVVLDQYPEAPVTVTSSKPGIAAATYAYDPDGPVDGHREGGIVFPRQIGDQRLVAAAVSEPGDPTVSVEVLPEDTRGAAQISFATVCVGFDQDAGSATSANGEELTSGGSCTVDPGVVHGTEASFEVSDTLPASGTFSSRALRMGEDGDVTDQPLDEPRGRVGLAVYASDMTDVDFLGHPQPRTQVWGGHLWTLAGSTNGTETSTVDDLDTATQWLASAIVVMPAGSADQDASTRELAVAADGRDVPAPTARFVGRDRRSGISTGPALLPLGTRTATVPETYLSGADRYQLLAWKLLD